MKTETDWRRLSRSVTAGLFDEPVIAPANVQRRIQDGDTFGQVLEHVLEGE